MDRINSAPNECDTLVIKMKSIDEWVKTCKSHIEIKGEDVYLYKPVLSSVDCYERTFLMTVDELMKLYKEYCDKEHSGQE